jgi:hypothetical protein
MRRGQRRLKRSERTDGSCGLCSRLGGEARTVIRPYHARQDAGNLREGAPHYAGSVRRHDVEQILLDASMALGFQRRLCSRAAFPLRANPGRWRARIAVFWAIVDGTIYLTLRWKEGKPM